MEKRTETRQSILLLDDDQGLLDLYKEILKKLPSQPEVHTASSGARAMALLESGPFAIFICDLKMPRMDGLQVLSIVRKKFPQLRTVVLTAVLDEQFRSRVYALGVDLFWEKPSTQQEVKLFLDCLESLLGRETGSGFRGVQDKSLVDIIQLECISHNSTTLKITNGLAAGRIWIQNGEVIDAETQDLAGERAFQRILAWKTGAFENLPAEPKRERQILKSYNALLLETAQAYDEARGQETAAASGDKTAVPASPLARLPRSDEMEFALALKPGGAFDSRGLENAEPTATWARQTLENFRALGEQLRIGPLQQVEALGPQRHVALSPREGGDACVGWKHTLSAQEVQEQTRKLLTVWAS